MFDRNIEIHVQVIGWLYILGNLILIFIGLLTLVFLPAVWLAAQDPTATGILSAVGLAVSVFFTILALPGLFAGYGLLMRRPWARILGLIVAFFQLANFPVGTIVGIYAFVVLLQSGANEYFAPLKTA